MIKRLWVAAAAICFSATAAEAATFYNVTTIGRGLIPSQVDESGRVLYNVSNGAPMIWQNGTTTSVSNVPGVGPQALDFNSTTTVGYSTVGGYVVAWAKTGNTYTQLAGLGGTTVAQAINSSGKIVGYSSANTYNAPSHVLTWSGTMMTDLGTMSLTSASAADINDAGTIVGVGSNSSLTTAFVYKNGQVTYLGSGTSALAINEIGTVAGYMSNASDGTHGFLWSNGTLTDVGTLAGYNYYRMSDVNDSNVAVGQGNTSNGYSAIAYQDGALVDLNTLIDSSLGVRLTSARSINNAGQILAVGTKAGNGFTFLLDPFTTVPEPSSWALMILGFGAVGGALRRHRAPALA